MRASTFDSRGEGIRRIGAFAVALLLAAVVFVVTAPGAYSQTIASVAVGACGADGTEAPVTVTVSDGYAVDIVDSDGVATYFAAPGDTVTFPVGSYTWIAFEFDDPLKTPVEEGAFEILCGGETTTTTVAETTTTTVAETTTTTVVEVTTTTPPTESTVITSTTVPEEPTTTEVGQSTVTTSTTVPPVSASTLPFTGSELQMTALLGALALSGGVMLVIAGRRQTEPAEEDSLGDW